MIEVKNMYLDFRKNEGNLKRALIKMKDSYPDFFKDYIDGEDYISYLLKKVFPEGFTRSFYVSNTSLKDQYLDLTIRPKIDGPLLESVFPKGLSIAIRGHFSPPVNPVLIIDRVTEISDSEQRDFEQEIVVRTFSEQKNVYQIQRENNVFTTEFIVSLPEISKETSSKLKLWNEYLEWNKQIVRNKQDGVKYLDVDIEDGNLIFRAIFENRGQVGRYRRFLRRGHIMAYPIEYSKHEWEFRLNESKFIRGTDIGDFVDIKEIIEVKNSSYFKIQDMLEDLNCGWESPVLAKVVFKLTDEDQNDVINANGEDVYFLYGEILNEYPKNGFLSESSAGEFALIRRQKQVLDHLQLESGYAPFLSSWLFDISKANKTKLSQPIEKLNRDDLNQDQQLAVEKMINSPDVFLLQGPPGTGKTTVIAEAIYQFTKQGKKVILASQANLAVDNVFERLANSPEIRAIRLGKERKLSEEGKQFSEKQVLKWFYSSISSGIREKFIKRWTDRDHKLEELQHLMDDTKFVKADLSRYADTILQFQQLVQQTNFQLKQEEQYINKIREQARVNMETKENIIKLKDYINHSNETNFNIPAYLLNFIFQNFLEPAKTLEKHHIILDEFWLKNDDRLSDSEKTKAFKLFWNKWGNLKKFLPKLEQDILSFRQASGGLDVSTMYEIQELEQKIKEIEVEMEEDASKFTIWRKIRNEIKELKNNRTAVLDEGYSTIFNGMINGEKYSDILKSKLEADKTELSEELLYIYQDIIKLEQIINESMQPLFSEMDKYYKSISEAAVDESKYKKLQAELSRHQLELKGLYERYNEKQKLLSSLYNDMRKHSDDDFSDEEAVDAANAIISALNNISQADKKFEDDWKPLFEEWTSMLENEKTAKNDYEYYLEIYLDACNVVGVTCTENARVLEENNHTIFDIAIIDEVSKATPPELLMPMIRAKKTILVGDHRQLPPIFKEQESSYEELIKQLKEEQDELPPEEQTFDDKLLNVENFDRFKSMVTASLFKDYFEQADPTIKEALLTQYRMHPDIMDVINQFYENRLKCGITNPDEVRNHGLTITSPEGLEFITPDRHAIWIDTSKNPFGEQNFEEQMGTSKINTLESILIAETLKKIDEQYTKAGVKGKKDVGVISFYGKQVGEIRRRIRNIKFESINVDINTVDKFQGKEKSIILVSLVRNKNVRKKSQNSFVAAFERINVAFSRAKELLVVLGAKDMFYDYDVELPNMDNTGSTTKRVYRDIMDRLQLKGCLWESRRVITPEQYHQLMTKQADKEKKLQTISN